MIEIFDWIAKKPFEWLTIGHETKEDDQYIFSVDHFDDSNLLLLLYYFF